MIRHYKIKIARNFITRLLGIYPYKNRNVLLIIKPCCDIHSAFLSKNLDVAFFNEYDRVVYVQRDLKPWNRLRIKEAEYVIERFADPSHAWYEKGDKLNKIRLGGSFL